MNYAALAKTVDRLFAAKGQQVRVTRYAPSRNSSTGAITRGAAIYDVTVNAIEVDASKMPDELHLDPSVLVTKTARMFKLSPALGFAPQPTDWLTINEDGGQTVWPIVGVAHTHPAGIPLVYTVGIAK